MLRAALRSLLVASCLASGVMAARAEILSMPVPVQTIKADSVLTPEMFVLKSFKVNEVAKRNFAVGLEQLLGKQTARSLAAGRPVALKSVQASLAVKKGDAVPAIFASDAIRIEATLVAMEDGVPGDLIKAKNVSSGIVVDARVADNGTLIIGEP